MILDRISKLIAKSKRLETAISPRAESFLSAQSQLVWGRYDAEGWHHFVDELARSTPAERHEIQTLCDSVEDYIHRGNLVGWVESLYRYLNQFGRERLSGQGVEPSPVFEIVSSFYAQIRPNPASMQRVERAMSRIDGNEIDALFGPDAWLHNLALSFWEYVKGETRLQSYPWNITIPIADLCNARCSFCTSWLEGRELITRAQLNSLKEVIQRAVFVGLVGHGEPLAHPEFPEIADRLSKYLDRRSTLYTITNGLLINKLYDKLGKIRVRSYSISLNAASAATHNRVMALGPHAFDEVLSGLSKLIKYRKNNEDLNLYITMVVTSENVHEVADFVRLGNDLDVTGIWLRSLLPQTESHCWP